MGTLSEKVKKWLENHHGAISRESHKSTKGVELRKLMEKDADFHGTNTSSIQPLISNIAKEREELEIEGKKYLLVKVPEGQGYFLAEIESVAGNETIQRETDARSSSATKTQTSKKNKAGAQAIQQPTSPSNNEREEVFRSLLYAYDEISNEEEKVYPFILDHKFAKRSDSGTNFWRYPDFIRIVWNQELFDGERTLLKHIKANKTLLGENLFRIESWELKLEAKPTNVREVFFQALSNSSWSHLPVLAFAMKISDQYTREELVRLGGFYNVRIVCFDFSADQLDGVGKASDILNARTDPEKDMNENGYKIITEWKKPEVIIEGKQRPSLDWAQLLEMNHQHVDLLQKAIPESCDDKAMDESFIDTVNKVKLMATRNRDQETITACEKYLGLFERK
jgi:hypothetical protein